MDRPRRDEPALERNISFLGMATIWLLVYGNDLTFGFHNLDIKVSLKPKYWEFCAQRSNTEVSLD